MAPFSMPWLEEGIDVEDERSRSHAIHALRFVTEYAAPQIDRPFAEALANELRTNGTPVDKTSYKAMVERLKTSTGLKARHCSCRCGLR